jgi:hypothetical protein
MKGTLSRCSLGLVVLVAFAVAAAGCGATDISAYSVNGHSVSQKNVDDELKALRDNSEFRALEDRLEANGQGLVVSENANTVTSTLTATWMSNLIQDELVKTALAQRHAKVSPAARRAAAQLVAQVFGTKAVFDAFPKWFRDTVTAREARLLALAESLNADITTQAGANAVGSLLIRLGRKAHVTVDPRYGTWSAKRLAVEAPLVPGAHRAPAGTPTPTG